MDPLVPITDVSVEANTPVVAPPNPVGVAPVVTPVSPVTVNPVNPVVVAPNPVGVTPIVAPVSPVTVSPVNPVVVPVATNPVVPPIVSSSPVVKPPTVGPVVSVVGTTAPMSTSSVGNIMPVISGGTTSSVVAPAYMNPTQNMPVRPVVTGTTTIPKSEPTKEDNGGRGMDKKLGIGGTVVVAVVSMLILGTGLGVGVRLALTSQEAKKTEASNGVDRLVPTAAVDPYANVEKKVFCAEYSKVLTVTPAAPTMLELDAVYKRARVNMEKRDYSAFKTDAACSKYTVFEYPVETWDRKDVTTYTAKKLQLSPEQAFEKMVIPHVVFNAPLPTAIKPTSVETIPSENVGLESRNILDDGGKLVEIDSPVSRYRSKLNYTFANQNYSGTGSVIFSYEGGKWLYAGEVWFYSPIPTGKTYGDSVVGKTKIPVVVDASKSELATELKQGQAIEWSGFEGLVYSLGDANEHWNSQYLHVGNKFVKTFDKVGLFEYEIYAIDKLKGLIKLKGSVNVK